MKNPNWCSEELKLALQLYLLHGFKWLNSTTEDTREIVDLSMVLNSLDLVNDTQKAHNFRSPASIRMKLMNFKGLDPRYGRSGLPNCGQLDKQIWNEYNHDFEKLKEECVQIVRKHSKEHRNLFQLEDREDIDIIRQFDEFCEMVVERSKQFRLRAISEENIEVSQDIVNGSYSIIQSVSLAKDSLRKYKLDVKHNKKQLILKNNGHVEHTGVNLATIDYKKIGQHVQKTMGELISGKNISGIDLLELCSEDWSRKHLHIGHPFLKQIDKELNLKEQLDDSNGYRIYWKKRYTIEYYEYVICKEWYENNRVYFDRWVSDITQKNNEDVVKRNNIISILNEIKREDEENVCIHLNNLYKKYDNIQLDIRDLVDRLITMKVLSRFQEYKDRVVVEDYELLFKLISDPKKIINGGIK